MVKKKIPKQLEKIVKNYVSILQEDNLPINKVILFGSYAKGTQHKWSDVDIAVVSPKFKDSWEALRYLSDRAPFDMKYTIEAHGFTPEDFNNKYDSLIHEIKTHGIELTI